MGRFRNSNHVSEFLGYYDVFTVYLISGNAVTADVEKAAFPLSTP